VGVKLDISKVRLNKERKLKNIFFNWKAFVSRETKTKERQKPYAAVISSIE